MKKLSCLSMTFVALTAFGFEDFNDPRFMGNDYIRSFDALPAGEQLLPDDQMPWASSFWPEIYGGIAFRWNGYHAQTPYFAQLHYKINDIKEEISTLKQKLYSSNISSYETNEINNKIISLENQKFSILGQKNDEHDKVLFSYKRPGSLKDVKRMSQDDIYKLSPAEKFDLYKILMGKSSSFKLTKDVLKHASPHKAYWEGICHGWSSAAIEFHEPKPVTVKKKGIELTLNSSDLKALLSYYHARITRSVFGRGAMQTNWVGKKCGVTFPESMWSLENGVEYYKTVENGQVVKKVLPPECVDVNAGAFHIVIANQISVKKQGFVAEAVRDMEVWNQPVFGYDTKVIQDSAPFYVNKTAGTVRQVKVQTAMYYANDGGRMFWEQADPTEEFFAWEEPTNGTNLYRYSAKQYEYIIDIDSNGQIIGGHWLSYERPDFLWLKRNKGFDAKSGVAKYMNDLKNLVELR